MSDGAAARLADAGAAAEDLIALLYPACERIEVAGSIRRLVDVVHDIELVAIPKFETTIPAPGLFESTEVQVNLLRQRVDALIGRGRLALVPDDPKLGDRYAKLVDVETGLQLDLFSVLPPAQWGVLFLIRTGSAGYSNWFVKAVRDRGFHVTDGALHRGSLGCRIGGCEVMSTPEERDVFALTGIPATPPHLRAAG
jgi:DNA polymerase/3'-5' exonuclease PolX